jgi:hypothetical protein
MTNPDLRRDSLRLFPEAYRHTISEGAPVRLPQPPRWWLGVAGVVATWLVVSTITWLYLTYPTEQTLNATMRSLKKVMNRQTTLEASTKWRPLAFALQNGTYRLTLPSSLPLLAASGSAAGATVAPLVIAINGQGGYSAGTAAQVQSWLSRGSTTFPLDQRPGPARCPANPPQASLDRADAIAPEQSDRQQHHGLPFGGPRPHRP